MPALRLERLRMAFPGLDLPALDIPSLGLSPGEGLVLTGPSGCGKTTLVNILCGLERAQEGAVRWGDVELAKLSEAARDRWRAEQVGLVMQEFHLFPGLSALDNVLLPKRLRRLRLPAPAAAEAKRLLERVGISRPGQAGDTMSRGPRQRVACARALLGNPSILVADEPTASLDAEAGNAVANLILELATERGANLIVATHDKALEARLDRVVTLEAGRIVSRPRLGPQFLRASGPCGSAARGRPKASTSWSARRGAKRSWCFPPCSSSPHR